MPQSLGVVERLFPQIATGQKTSTIRWRECRITSGLLLFTCDGKPNQTIDVMVHRCTDMPLYDVADFLDKADEWPDDILLTGMQEHYPDIQLSSTVQVIEFAVCPQDNPDD